MDVYASPANIALAREMVSSGRAPAAMLEQARAVLTRMEANPGGFVTFAEDTQIRLDTVYPLPRAVALLVDRRCASSCEQFILDARQSRKVTVIGTGNTRGMLDYGNLRRVPLPSGQRRFFMPTARSRRLPANSMDRTGIAPAVLVPPGADPLVFAIQHLH
jgi:C-terminal processing protease CtpA/Prc